ncbi:hypothetical protein M7I_4104 [Glarea lozoyensis 74030]|uniref:Xylanolytic transcriptional activator regulatory domain-containing protein n=1 Tax=Glarea lozoyensis (strain ATCC 74030 / MF5533) TaxID=1104152 RepID=H0ENA1_GLAL7|nr:hypothetical protein M7I_4104 [Glarea lozoyensis 74030]
MFISLAHRLYRCVKDGKPCVFLEAKPRPKRAKNSKLRVEEMEEKLETLAALLATVQGERGALVPLETELKSTLMKKILVEGEKSLDLLQGLLVYLAWYHFHFNVVQEQMYQLCQMAVAMMVDLGINKPNSSTNSLDAQAYHDSPSLSASSENLERRRTYLGCYYIVASPSLNLKSTIQTI